MADISKIKPLGYNEAFDIKDASAIQSINASSADGQITVTPRVGDNYNVQIKGAIHYIVGPATDTTAGTWTGVDSTITAYYDGLTIIYVPKVAGASTTTLNINGLGAKTCYSTNTSKLTTHFSVNTPIMLTYVGGSWKRADYDSNTNTQIRVYRQTTGYNNDYPLLVSRTVASSIGTVGTNDSYSGVYGVIWNDATKIPTLNPSTGMLKVPGGITATLTGNADTATKLATGRTFKVNLASTSASTAFDGSANIADIGVSGALPIANGGTGATTAAGARTNLGLGSMATETAANYILKSVLSGAYDIMYSSAANTPARLAANTTTTKKFLRMTGTGSAGAAPAWDTVTKSDVGLGNVTNDAQIPKSIGTTKGDIIYWSAASTPARLGIGSAGQVLKVSSDGVPVWSSDNNSLNWGQITQSGANNIDEGTSDFTDNTEIFSSYASNNGFADTNATGKVYRRDAVKMYNYIKTKLAVTNNNISVGWNTETTIATIGGTAIKIKIPAQTNLSGGSAAANDATVVGGVTVSNHAVTVAKKTMTASTGITIAGVTDKVTFSVKTSDLYWADQNIATSKSYKTTPEVANIKINGDTSASAASTKNVQLTYDSELEVLNFVFS